MKRSFLLYSDFIEQIEMLDRGQKGDLLEAIFREARGEQVGDLDPLTRMAFSMIAAQMRYDNSKYEEVCAKRSKAGRISADARRRKNLTNSTHVDDNDTDTEAEAEDETEASASVSLAEAKKSVPAQQPRASHARDAERAAERERYYAQNRAKAEREAALAEKKAMADGEYASAVRILRQEEINEARAELYSPKKLPIIRERIEHAERRRRSALKRLGMTEEDLHPHYTCEKCSDTGFLPNGTPCTCWVERRNSAQQRGAL